MPSSILVFTCGRSPRGLSAGEANLLFADAGSGGVDDRRRRGSFGGLESRTAERRGPVAEHGLILRRRKTSGAWMGFEERENPWIMERAMSSMSSVTS
jgi:hypothetical protein